MHERPFDESFTTLNQLQTELEKHGWHFFPIPKEHTEGLIIEPLIARIRTRINKRGFVKLAGHSIMTFSGFAKDPREIHQIPEIQLFWRKLDQQLPELPALLGSVIPIRYNGPVMHLSLLGEIDEIVDHPEQQRQDLHVIGADRMVTNAIERIYAAGRRHHLSFQRTYRLVTDFIACTTFPN